MKYLITGYEPPRTYLKDGTIAYSFAKSGRLLDLDWNKICVLLSDHKEVNAKHNTGLIAPMQFRDNVRLNTNATDYSLLIIDVDNKGELEDQLRIEDAAKALESQEYAALIYTSFSHTDERHKFRIVCPLKEPVLKDFMLMTYHGFITKIGLADKLPCMDRSCMSMHVSVYYLPSHPTGGKYRVERIKGRPVDIEELPKEYIKQYKEAKEKSDDGLDYKFMRKYKGDFRHLDITKLELLRGRDVKSVGVGEKEGWLYIECPWHEHHSTKDQEKDCAIINRPDEYPVFHCLHDSCKQAGPNRIKEYLELFTEDEVNSCFSKLYDSGQHDAVFLEAMLENKQWTPDELVKHIRNAKSDTAEDIRKIMFYAASLDELEHDGILKEIQTRFRDKFASIKPLKSALKQAIKERKKYEDAMAEIKTVMNKEQRIQQAFDRSGRLLYSSSSSKLYQWHDTAGWIGHKKDLTRNVLTQLGVERDILNVVQDEIPWAADVVYYPPTDEPVFEREGVKFINTYRGIPTIPKQGDYSLMTDLLLHLLGEDSDKIDYVWDWLAAPLQRIFNGEMPRKNLTALVFHGAEGTGKNCFAEIMKNVYGHKNFGVLDQAALEDRFTPSCLYSSLFICANEVNFDASKGRASTNKQKEWITESTINCRRMYESPADHDTFFNMVYFSNESVPVYIETGNRRYSIFFQDDKLPQQIILKYREELANGFPCAQALLHMLLNRDIQHNISQPLHTTATDALIERNKNSAKLFVDDIIKYGILDVAHHYSMSPMSGGFLEDQDFVKIEENGRPAIYVYHQLMGGIYGAWTKANGRRPLATSKLLEILSLPEFAECGIIKKNVRFPDGRGVKMCYGGRGFVGKETVDE